MPSGRAKSICLNKRFETRGGSFSGARPAILALILGLGLFCAAGLMPGAAFAQSIITGGPPPNQTPTQPANDRGFGAFAPSTFDLGTTFLQRLGRQATYGFNTAARANPEGGGAPEGFTPKWRSWVEGYASHSRQDARGIFFSDTRRTTGGVAGLSATVTPGVTLGLSLEQNHSRINVPDAGQSAKLDMSQIGGNAAFERGNWTAAIALVHGLAKINSSRLDGATIASATYNARLTGVLGEVAYYHGIGQGRIVPKAALEWMKVRTDALTETSGTNPIMASGQQSDRTRLYLGAEMGHYWIVDQKIIDLSAYGKFVDNLRQNIGSVNVNFANGIGTPLTVQGIGESRYGFDTGATFSLSFTQSVRAYLAYDGKFREGFRSHMGTAGIDVRW